MGRELENIDLTVSQRKEIVSLLNRYLPDTEVWAYGSRVKFTAKPSSDLDLVAFALKEQSFAIANLKEAFEESSLPFRVDLFVWDEVPEQFRKNIEKERVVLQEKKNEGDLPKGWEEKKVGDVCYVTDGAHSKVDRQPNGVLYLTSKNNGVGNLILDKVDYISINDYERLFTNTSRSQRRLITGDVLIGIIGTFGNAYRYKEGDHFGVSSAVAILRPDKKVLDSEYLYYVVTSSIFKNTHAAYKSGSAQGYTNIPTIKQLPLPLPPLHEQKAIAHILGSLDKKIKLNRRMNETLESMAQALFKSWFVDFDPVIDNALAAGNEIPDALDAKAATRLALGENRKPLPEEIRKQFPNSFKYTEEMGWIPEGWKVQQLNSLVDIIGGGTPKTSIPEYWDGEIPWFSVVDAPNSSDVFVINTEKSITELGVQNSSTKILPVGTTIISARGTVGKCAMVGRPMAMNQSCYGINARHGVSDIFVYYTVLLRVSDLQQKSHGSVFSTITRDTFKTIQVPFSGLDLINKFDTYTESFLNKILSNSKEIVTLSRLRDTLLPKLLSGELRIPDAENLIQDAS
jgi:type I restriction enzyme, S subunit